MYAGGRGDAAARASVRWYNRVLPWGVLPRRWVTFEVAPDAPLWLFLPAVWPVESRAWIRDNRIRQLRTMIEGRWVDLPWGTADYVEPEAGEQPLIQALGLPPRPAGRVWLLRPPPGVSDRAHS